MSGEGPGVFSLAAKEDPLLAQVVPAARKRVATMHKLTFGARNFFQWLTDQSLTPGSNLRKGVLKISDEDAGARFRVHSKTIRNWKREIQATGEVWLTEKFMKNSFAQTVYNITAIVGQATLPFAADSQDGSLPEDEVWSSNRRRQQAVKRDAATGSFVCRRHGQAGCQLCRQWRTPPGGHAPEVSPENSRIQAETEAVEKILPPTTAPICRPPRQNGAAHHGKTVPSPTAKRCRPARQNGAVVDGTNLPPTTAPICRSERQDGAGNGETGVRDFSHTEGGKGKEAPPADALEVEFKRWEVRLDDMRNSDLRSLETLLKGQFQTARSDATRALVKRKLVAVRLRLLGPQVEPEPATATASTARVEAPKVKPLPLEKCRELLAKAKAEAKL